MEDFCSLRDEKLVITIHKKPLHGILEPIVGSTRDLSKGWNYQKPGFIELFNLKLKKTKLKKENLKYF